MPAGGRPTVRSRRLGLALKNFRIAARLDQPQAAEVIAVSASKISRIETGHVSARVIEVRLLLDTYGVADPEVRTRLEELAKGSNRRGWWLEHAAHLRGDYLDHISLEDDATYMREWQPVLVPGLLQTPAYARAAITAGPSYVADERVEQLLKVREARQAKIEAGGTNYTAIIWEPVVIHPLLAIDSHHEQLDHILDAGQRKNVTVQVLPFSAGVPVGATSAFSSFSFESEPIVEAVTMENLRGTSVLEDLDDLTAYTNAFDQLRSAALTPDASVRLIRDALRSNKKDTS